MQAAAAAAAVKKAGPSNRQWALKRKGTMRLLTATTLATTSIMAQRVYEHGCMLMIKALLEEAETFEEAEAMRLARSAWTSDTRGRGILSHTLFNDAIFE